VKPFVWGVVLCWLFWAHHDGLKFYRDGYAIDARIYYHAAQGDMRWIYAERPWLLAEDATRTGWIYHPALTVLWKPWLMMSERTYLVIWQLLLTACYLILVHKLLKVRYGWIVVLATLRSASWFMVSGNVQFILFALLTTLPGAWVAAAVKPPLALVRVLGDLKPVLLWARKESDGS